MYLKFVSHFNASHAKFNVEIGAKMVIPMPDLCTSKIVELPSVHTDACECNLTTPETWDHGRGSNGREEVRPQSISSSSFDSILHCTEQLTWLHSHSRWEGGARVAGDSVQRSGWRVVVFLHVFQSASKFVQDRPRIVKSSENHMSTAKTAVGICCSIQ